MGKIKIMLPHGEIEGELSDLAPRVASLEGKRIGFIDNDMWRSMHLLVDDLGKIFTSEYGAVGTETINLGPGIEGDPKKYQETLEEFTDKVDAVVSGLGN